MLPARYSNELYVNSWTVKNPKTAVGNLTEFLEHRRFGNPGSMFIVAKGEFRIATFYPNIVALIAISGEGYDLTGVEEVMRPYLEDSKE